MIKNRSSHMRRISVEWHFHFDPINRKTEKLKMMAKRSRTRNSCGN
jgi:hypothetical protein